MFTCKNCGEQSGNFHMHHKHESQCKGNNPKTVSSSRMESQEETSNDIKWEF